MEQTNIIGTTSIFHIQLICKNTVGENKGTVCSGDTLPPYICFHKVFNGIICFKSSCFYETVEKPC